MTTTPLDTFRIIPVAADVIDAVRAGGVDISGNAAHRIEAQGGEPLRCCLRDAEPSEGLLLFGYEPAIPMSPYREFGAILVHAESCDGPPNTLGYPHGFYGRPQVLRAYDKRGWIHDATRMHDGSSPETAIVEMLADPTVVQIHSRNVTWGCYMFTITRTG